MHDRVRCAPGARMILTVAAMTMGLAAIDSASPRPWRRLKDVATQHAEALRGVLVLLRGSGRAGLRLPGAFEHVGAADLARPIARSLRRGFVFEVDAVLGLRATPWRAVFATVDLRRAAGVEHGGYFLATTR